MTIKLKINKSELSLIKYYKFICALILKYYNLIMVYGTYIKGNNNINERKQICQ